MERDMDDAVRVVLLLPTRSPQRPAVDLTRWVRELSTVLERLGVRDIVIDDRIELILIGGELAVQHADAHERMRGLRAALRRYGRAIDAHEIGVVVADTYYGITDFHSEINTTKGSLHE